ncbi:MAG TPA: M1 family metallopeptidase [Gemmatimonadales bacterium]|nr:M1 family metallopeptidase [Gemmatimonadales bacterium]
MSKLLPGLALVSFALTACAGGSATQSPAPMGGSASAPARPRPYPVTASVAFDRAVAKGTRTTTGAPGPKYWTQWAEYRIQASIDPATAVLTGSETIKYTNRSPDTLRVVWLQVSANAYAPEAQRNDNFPITRAVQFTKVQVAGQDATTGGAPRPGTYTVDGTRMSIRLRAPLLPGQSVDLAFDWNYPIPPENAQRGGQDGHTWLVSYWYPQMAVYDDVNHTVPAGWLIGATGELVNADQVLSPQTRDRLAQARRSATAVRIVTAEDRGAGKATLAGTNGKLTWHFSARNVRDFTFGASAEYLWDGAASVVGDMNGDGKADTALADAMYRPEAGPLWARDAEYARHSVQFLSQYLWPYPWSHMTVVQGVGGCGGMEYPMLTCIQAQWPDDTTLYEVTVHEIAHMWFPMMVGSDERRYSWMDEGNTQYDQSQGMQDFYPGFDDEARNRNIYLGLARNGAEATMMTQSDWVPNGFAFGVASYFKQATTLVALRSLIGREAFERGLRTYGRQWMYKHPMPYDFFNTFNTASGQDLDWFWRTWYFETWTLDQAIASVTPKGSELEVVIQDKGLAPMPVRLALTRGNGTVEHREIPVSVWLAGNARTTITVPGDVTKIEIDPTNGFPDVDRSNNRWSK